MHLTRFFLLLIFCVGCALCATQVVGNDPPSEIVVDAEARQTLDEIEKIRNQLGGGVLKGTSLQAAEDDHTFDESVRRILQSKNAQPATWNIEQSPVSRSKLNGPKVATPNTTSPHSSVSNRSPRQIVELMRTRSVQLEAIANQIETLREYDKADQLRNIATDLRILARQFDAPKSGTRILPER